ncbi:MAG: ATP-binding protein, partial [Cyanobacteria bacterium P01_F01_bin.53]
TQDLIEVITLYQQHCPNTDDTLQEAIEDIDLDFIQSDMSKMLGSMKMGTERIRQIVLSLRNFSRMDEAGFKTVNIHEGINSTLALLQNQLEATDNAPAIQVTQTYDELPLVECSAGHLNQVFMNILTNAIDALRSGPGTSGPDINPQNKEQSSQPHITIRTSIIQPPIAIPSKSSASASASETGEWLETKWVQIEIADNGPGMTEAVQKSMFEPFFTTKPVGQGNGLGMSLSYQIITDRHHGKLECASTPGQGTTLKIQLPCHQHKTVRILAESMAPQVMKTQSMASAKA